MEDISSSASFLPAGAGEFPFRRRVDKGNPIRKRFIVVCAAVVNVFRMAPANGLSRLRCGVMSAAIFSSWRKINFGFCRVESSTPRVPKPSPDRTELNSASVHNAPRIRSVGVPSPPFRFSLCRVPDRHLRRPWESTREGYSSKSYLFVLGQRHCRSIPPAAGPRISPCSFFPLLSNYGKPCSVVTASPKARLRLPISRHPTPDKVSTALVCDAPISRPRLPPPCSRSSDPESAEGPDSCRESRAAGGTCGGCGLQGKDAGGALFQRIPPWPIPKYFTRMSTPAGRRVVDACRGCTPAVLVSGLRAAFGLP